MRSMLTLCAYVGTLILMQSLVMAKPNKLKKSDVRKELVAQVKARVPWPDARVQIQDLRIAGKLPRTTQWTIEMFEPVSWRHNVRAKLKVSDSKRRPIWLNARVLIEIPVVVTTRTVARGASLAQAQRMEHRSLHTLPHDVVTNLDALDGVVARRSMSPGFVVRQSALKRPVLIKRGQIIGLRVRRGGVVITSRGIAQQSGRLSDTIRIKMPSTQKILMGVVRAQSLVELP